MLQLLSKMKNNVRQIIQLGIVFSDKVTPILVSMMKQWFNVMFEMYKIFL